MRKVFLHFAVTLDGMVSNVEQWVSFTDEAMQDGSAWHDTIDTIIFGNNNYAPLAGYWQDAETSAKSAEERAFAKKINDMHKLVLSHGNVELVWRNSEVLQVKDSDEFKQAIAKDLLQPLDSTYAPRHAHVAQYHQAYRLPIPGRPFEK